MDIEKIEAANKLLEDAKAVKKLKDQLERGPITGFTLPGLTLMDGDRTVTIPSAARRAIRDSVLDCLNTVEGFILKEIEEL